MTMVLTLFACAGVTITGTGPEQLTDTGLSSDTGDVDDTDTDTDTDTDAGSAESIDYRAAGPHSVTGWTDSYTVNGCSMSVSFSQPSGDASAPLVVLAHGFARGPAQMEGWAREFAAWGVTVAVPSLCHSSFTNADHEANGRDLVSLVSMLGMGDSVYMGHSAGGLAALVAASEDSSAVAVIGLDMTDADGIGTRAASSVRVPVYGLVGEPSACNSDNNGMASYASISTATAVRVTDSDHCDYENETDWMCSWFCPAGGGSFSDSEIHDTVRALSIAALMEGLGLEPVPGAWWSPGGDYYSELVASGAIAPL